jgi:hypothetical protein
MRKTQISSALKLYTCTARKGIQMGITSSLTWSLLKDWNSAGNHQFLDVESTKGMELCLELPAPGLVICRQNGIPPGINGSWPWIQTGKIKSLPIGTNTRKINSKGSLPQ